MLARDFPDKKAVMNEFCYRQNDILHEEYLRSYIAHTDGTISRVENDF
jgi:hypothetical protein